MKKLKSNFLIFVFSLAACSLQLTACYAMNLDKLKVYFLAGDYKSAISEGEKLLAKSAHPDYSDELYYLLGLSYMKDGNYLRASDIFEIILKEFKESKFKEEAKLGLGDTYLLRGDSVKARDCYEDLIKGNSGTRLKAQVYYRLSQIGFRIQDTQAAKDYLDKIKADFPLSPELRLDKDSYSLLNSSADIYYTVQVGAFSNIENAKGIAEKLAKHGYPAYIEEVNSGGKQSYRVRAGKMRLRQEALALENKLSQEGYPTKIYP